MSKLITEQNLRKYLFKSVILCDIFLDISILSIPRHHNPDNLLEDNVRTFSRINILEYHIWALVIFEHSSKLW